MATLLENGDQFIGSHMKAEAKTGQNGGLNPASTMGMKPGEKLPRSKLAASILASDPVIATAGESFQTRSVASKAYPSNPGAQGRLGANARVPSGIDHGQRQAMTSVMSRQQGKRGK